MQNNNSSSNVSSSDIAIDKTNSETNINSANNAKPSPTENLTVVKPTSSPKMTETPAKESVTPVKEEIPSPTATPKPVPKVISGGVLNGKARNLVKPQYPPAARAVRASGQVTVQVTIDENGSVISASAVSGHPLLRQSAVQAARQSTFNPTLLSGQPVKVTGVIVYNFIAPD